MPVTETQLLYGLRTSRWYVLKLKNSRTKTSIFQVSSVFLLYTESSCLLFEDHKDWRLLSAKKQ